jgi:hypothetical protein
MNAALARPRPADLRAPLALFFAAPFRAGAARFTLFALFFFAPFALFAAFFAIRSP